MQVQYPFPFCVSEIDKMGNEVSKKYNLSEEHNATAGHCQLWKIYPGHVVHKDKVTTTDISVWMFLRDGLAKRTPVAITDKSAQEQLMQIMKKDMSLMKEKDMQHQGIVKVLEVTNSLTHSLTHSLTFVIKLHDVF